MLKNKGRSLSEYIVSYYIFIFILFFAFSIFCISFFSSILISYDINQKMILESNTIFENLRFTDGKFFVDESKIHFKSGDFTFVILDQAENIIYGEYPEAYFDSFKIKEGFARTAIGVETSYYYNDVEYFLNFGIDGNFKKNIIIRTFVPKQSIKSNYTSLRGLSYFCMALVFMGSIVCVMMLIKKVNKPLKELCDTAEKIVQSQDLSQRMNLEEDAFEEVKIMVNANNTILDRAQEMIETQKRFSSDVAHELKTPISVIMAECQYGIKYIDSQQEMINAFSVINEEAQKTNYIINQIFELTKLEKRQVKVQKEGIHLGDLIYTICESEPLLTEKKIQMEIDIDEVMVLADLSLLFIALRNIINNAAKYSEAESSIHIYDKREDGMIFIYCEDHGCGIDEEDFHIIFQRFYQADQSRSSEGLGLGLSITKMIVELLDGQIFVQSKKGEGSTFVILLPEYVEKM